MSGAFNNDMEPYLFTHVAAVRPWCLAGIPDQREEKSSHAGPEKSRRYTMKAVRILLLSFFCLCLGAASAQKQDTIPTIPKLDSIEAKISDTMSVEMKKPGKRVFIPDTVMLKNGDRLTGKILSFEQGRLKMDAQGPGVITLKWYKIVTISGGNTIFKVSDQHGNLYYGYMQPSDDTGKIFIQGTKRSTLTFEEVVRLYPLEEEWYRGFKGNLGAGTSFTKSSEVLRINAEYNVYYVVKRWRFVNDFSYIVTSTDQDDPSVRIESNLLSIYSLPRRWLLSQFNAFNRNDELGIESRLSFGAGGGNNLVQTERQRFFFVTGFVVNLEQDIESQEVISNLEWPFTLQHSVYSFENPNLSSSVSGASFVGITDPGRYRLDASADITWEFISDIKLQFSVYYNYDNKNLEGKTTKEDYGTVLSLLIELK